MEINRDEITFWISVSHPKSIGLSTRRESGFHTHFYCGARLATRIFDRFFIVFKILSHVLAPLINRTPIK